MLRCAVLRRTEKCLSSFCEAWCGGEEEGVSNGAQCPGWAGGSDSSEQLSTRSIENCGDARDLGSITSCFTLRVLSSEVTSCYQADFYVAMNKITLKQRKKLL